MSIFINTEELVPITLFDTSTEAGYYYTGCPKTAEIFYMLQIQKWMLRFQESFFVFDETVSREIL